MISDGATSQGSLRTFLYRMARSCRLDGKNFRSLREDSKANRQSILVLALAGVLFGVSDGISLQADWQGILLFAGIGIIFSILLGFIWLSLTFLLGTRVLGGTSSYWGLARSLFFSASPAPVFLLMIIPVWPIPQIALSAAVAWISVASVIAVKNCLGIDNQRSLVAFIAAALFLIFAFGLIQNLVPYSF